MHEIDSMTRIIWVVLGGIGGMVKVCVQILSESVTPTWQVIFWRSIMNIFISGFTGFIGALIASTFTPNDDYHVIVAGVTGYMGVIALDLFSYFAKDWVTKQKT